MIKIALIGFGNVGQGFVSILRDKPFDIQLVAVVTGSRGSLYHPDGLNTAALFDFAHYPHSEGLIRDWDALQIIRESNADLIVEASPTNLQTAQPALSYCTAAIEAGKHLVLVNKGPVALAYADLAAKAQAAGVQLRFEGTVMAGTPSIRLAMQALQGCEIQSAKGILNGTTNYILDQMENDLGYEAALKQAQELGYAETDPSGDVDGWDAAGKVLILAAALFGQKLRFEDMKVTGISHITIEDVQAAKAEGKRWKLIATITPEGSSVAPMCLPLTDPLANVGGATNAITYHTDLMGDITLIGAGAGRIQTGFAILSDVLDIAATMQNR